MNVGEPELEKKAHPAVLAELIRQTETLPEQEAVPEAPEARLARDIEADQRQRTRLAEFDKFKRKVIIESVVVFIVFIAIGVAYWFWIRGILH